MTDDIRWLQRFSNLKKAFSKLQEAVNKFTPTQLEKEGLIQRFGYTFALAWNTMKDFYEHQAVTELQGSRDVIRLAFERGLITDGEAWMKMVESRILTSHTYHEEMAIEIEDKVRHSYFLLLEKLVNDLKSKPSENDSEYDWSEGKSKTGNQGSAFFVSKN